MRLAEAAILANRQVSERYWHMVVDARTLEGDMRPGQFFQIRCGESYLPFLRRPFSIYRINREEETIEFLYLIKGEGTERMKQMKPGGWIDLFGPLGRGFRMPERGPILIAARGVGIATLAALAQDAAEKGIASIVLLSARSRRDLLAVETLQRLGAEVHPVTDEEGTSEMSQVRKLLEGIIEEQRIQAVYTCGSKRLAKLLQDLAAEHRIYGEMALEEHMACGMGVCFACVCDVRGEDGERQMVRLCREGPVLPLERVVLI